MRNPFKRSGSHNDPGVPYGGSYQYTGPRPSSNKLIIVAGVITFLVIIIVMFESVVVVEAGHRRHITAIASGFGNSAKIIVPRSWLGRRMIAFLHPEYISKHPEVYQLFQ
jgi:putative transposon-encoded protein